MDNNKLKKKYIIIIVCLMGIIVFAIGGLFVLKKLKRMYNYTLDVISDSASNQTLDLTRKLNLAYDFDYSWAEDETLIAHAFGAVDGVTYTNSLEAFLENYEKGYRIFEVDFDLTDEEYALVLTHSRDHYINNNIPYTLENFMNTPIEDKYTPMSGRDLVELMHEYPDIYIVTDTKYADRTNAMVEFSQIVKYAEDIGDEGILSRIVPQIYNEDMFWAVMEVYEWDSVIFTLYATVWTPESVVDICNRTGIGFVTFWNSDATEDLVDMWKSNGLKLAVHTENDVNEAERYLKMGINMLYTDTLDPNDYK